MLELESLLINEEDIKEKTEKAEKKEKKEKKKRSCWEYNIEIDSGMDLAISKKRGDKENIFVLYKSQDLCYIKKDDVTISLLNCCRNDATNEINNFFKDLKEEETLKSLFYGEIGKGKKYAKYLAMIILCFKKSDLNFLVSLKSILGLENEVISEEISEWAFVQSRREEIKRKKTLNFFRNLVKNDLLSESDKKYLYKSFLNPNLEERNPKIDFISCYYVEWLIYNKTELAINLTKKMYENEHFLIDCKYLYLTEDEEEIFKKIFNEKYNNYNALIDFFVFQPKIQGFPKIHKFFKEYLDYLHLQMIYYGEIRDKYPQNILSDNQKLSAKYNEVKEIIDGKRFAETSEKQKKYEDKIDKYIFISPKTPGDMVDEARQQNNCLKSYIQSFLEGKTNIFFLRKEEEPETSFVTIEVRNGKLNQACLAYNKEPGKETKKIIQKWCDKHHIINNIFFV